VFLTLKNPIEMKKEHGTTVQSKRVHDRTTVVYSDCLPPPFPFQLRPPQLEVNMEWRQLG
jgi:hypothetical protein